MKYNNDVINSIKKHMAKNGLSQIEMAKKLEIAQVNLNRILTGKVSKARGVTAKKIIEVLGSDLDLDKLEY
jgi:predicted XRE-type DNA-binding protein